MSSQLLRGKANRQPPHMQIGSWGGGGGGGGGVGMQDEHCFDPQIKLRGAWSDRDTNDIFAHCSLIFYFLDLKFSNFVCPYELHPLIMVLFKKFLQEKEKYPKNLSKRLSS